MGTIVTSPAAEDPVSLDEMVSHLRVDPAQEDTAAISSWVSAATEYIQNTTARQFVTASLRTTFDRFPHNRVMFDEFPRIPTSFEHFHSHRTIELPRPPLQSVQSVKYLDPTGTEQTLSPSLYTVDTTSLPGRIVLNPATAPNTPTGWPLTLHVAGAIWIDFTAGYGDATTVPDAVKAAIKMLGANWFENRESTIAGSMTVVPMAVESIIQQFRFIQAI